MANPPNPNDPFNPARPTAEPRIDRTTIVQSGGSGSGWLVALVVVILAIGAYYVFARSGGHPAAPAEAPAASTTTPAPAPAEPMKPAAPTPATPAAPAPATPAPAPAPAAPAN